MNGNRVILAAHRGDRKNFPENTMPAFYSALRHGVDMIETDIHMTSDGFLVIMHDRSALRTTGTDAFIDQMTLEQARELDAGSMFSPAFAGTKVPTVAEFMHWVKDTNLLVNWELKDYVQDVGRERAFACADKLLEAIFIYISAKSYYLVVFVSAYNISSKNSRNTISKLSKLFISIIISEFPVYKLKPYNICSKYTK